MIRISNLSQLVADFEKEANVSARELSEVKCTMLANFDGRQKHLPKLLEGNEKTALEMFLKIIEHYAKN